MRTGAQRSWRCDAPVRPTACACVLTSHAGAHEQRACGMRTAATRLFGAKLSVCALLFWRQVSAGRRVRAMRPARGVRMRAAETPWRMRRAGGGFGPCARVLSVRAMQFVCVLLRMSSEGEGTILRACGVYVHCMCVHVCACICMYVWNLYVCMYLCMCVRMYSQICIYLSTFKVRLSQRAREYVRTCMHAYIVHKIYTRIYTRTHTHTRTCTPF